MHNVKEKIVFLIADFIAVNVSYTVFYLLRFRSGLFPVMEDVALVVPSLIISVFWIVFLALRGHYRTVYNASRFDTFTSMARTTFMGVLVLFIVFSPPEHPFGATRLIMGAYWGFLVITVGGFRVAILTVQRTLLKHGFGHRNTLIIGSGTEAKDLVQMVARHPELGNRILGYVNGDSDDHLKGAYSNLGKKKDLPDVLHKYEIAEVMVAVARPDHDELLSIIYQCSQRRVRVKVLADLYEILSGQARSQQILGMPLIEVVPVEMPPWQKILKEVMDVLVSLSILIVATPVMILVTAAIVLESKGPVFYKQLRIGKGGKEFILIKFRSMMENAEELTGAVWAGRDDPRVTRVGKIIRTLRLDELPQLINVLKGEMSLVGPRPERPVFVRQLQEEIPFYARRLNVKPGITGWAQIKHKYDESIDDVRKKLRYDLFYLENMSLRLDLKILLATIWVMLRQKGY
jgi:exopolysaccharide biosynthesis polyprenyl glycosylphosphotransferase